MSYSEDIFLLENQKIYVFKTNLVWPYHANHDQSPYDDGRCYGHHWIDVQPEPSVVTAQTYTVTLRLKLSRSRYHRLLLDPLGSLDSLSFWIHFTNCYFAVLRFPTHLYLNSIFCSELFSLCLLLFAVVSFHFVGLCKMPIRLVNCSSWILSARL